MNKNIFRAYDIRGRFPEQINGNIALTIGKAYGSKIKEKGFNVCIVGCDNRLSSGLLSFNLVKGILSTGVDVLNCGLVTTPMIYFYRDFKKIYCSVMVTASHNPGNENGFKFSFDETGNAKGVDITEFRDFIDKKEFVTGSGKEYLLSIENDYIINLLENSKFGNKRLKIAVDPGNGATCNICKKIFGKLPFEFRYVCDESDGTFPHHHPDPSVPKNLEILSRMVLKEKADIGVSFDGDGDRLGIIDNRGNFVSADIFSNLYIEDILLTSKNKKILYDNKCSRSIAEVIKKYQGAAIEYRTGASYTMAAVKDNNYAFGVEYSGHIYFNDRKLKPISSGIYAALRIIEIISNNTLDLATLIERIPKYYKIDEMRIPTSDEIKFEVVDRIITYAKENSLEYNTIDGIKIFDDETTILIRASNTGPNLTFIVESDTKEKLKEMTNFYLDLIKKYNEF